MSTVARPEKGPTRIETVKAWLEAPGFPLRVGQTYDLLLQFDHPGLPAVELADGPVCIEWIASSEEVHLAVLDPRVAVTECPEEANVICVARMTAAIGGNAGSIRLRLKITPRSFVSPRIALVLLLRHEGPGRGFSVPYHRFDIDLPTVP